MGAAYGNLALMSCSPQVKNPHGAEHRRVQMVQCAIRLLLCRRERFSRGVDSQSARDGSQIHRTAGTGWRPILRAASGARAFVGWDSVPTGVLLGAILEGRVGNPSDWLLRFLPGQQSGAFQRKGKTMVRRLKVVAWALFAISTASFRSAPGLRIGPGSEGPMARA